MEMCGLNLIMALDNVHFSLLKHRLEEETEGILWLTHQSRWRFAQVMDILIYLLYTGAQDGWMTINGRARLFPQNKEKDVAWPAASLWRTESCTSLCFEDDTSHLGFDVPVNTQRQSIHPEVTKVLLTQQLPSLYRDLQQVLQSVLWQPSTPSPHLIFTQPVSRFLSLLSPP